VGHISHTPLKVSSSVLPDLVAYVGEIRKRGLVTGRTEKKSEGGKEMRKGKKRRFMVERERNRKDAPRIIYIFSEDSEYKKHNTVRNNTKNTQ